MLRLPFLTTALVILAAALGLPASATPECKEGTDGGSCISLAEAAATANYVVPVADSKNSFYINIELTKDGKKQALEKAVLEETGGILPGYMAGLVAGFANKVVGAETVINEVANELVASIPAELAAGGVEMELRKRFVKGNLAVLHARVLTVDLAKGIKMEYKDEGAQHFYNMMAALDFFGVSEEKEGVLLELADEVMIDMMKEMQTAIPEEFANEGIECVVEVMDEKGQATYMLNQLENQL